MSRTFKLGVAAIAAASVMAVAPAVADGGSYGGSSDWSRGDNLNVVGLAEAGTKLVRFDTDNPGYVRSGVRVSGLTGGDTRLIGIDYRVQDGKLYGVGNNAASAGVYMINPDTGVATQVTRLTVALSGTTFGVDFNPAANALRVVSDTGRTCASRSPPRVRQPSPTAR